ncbi:pyocin knob domain-containing protein [Pelosinus propionicus]|uniref:Putative tail fiber protein gp53-like C-terminal domain-containing protein n=1 Tax=Pelosinus propionicus DSM 13327 TaxID=1123291 RepID=A0A1I4P1B9_9FIRM|nr:pyocin knob domain-containing protein [Pelosinus propionicus]SFM21548.1 hypothetical protein SAMN04490355_10569 [Pelosinus propionicus DSM 13327]
MSYPDDLEWNQPGVEPTQAKKDEGWKPEEKPPAEYFNWFFNRTSQAVKYLKGESEKSIDDDRIGNRTISDTVTATAGAGSLTNLLSKLGNMIKQITGKSAWYTAPATTLEAANTHINATSGAHTASAISSVATGDVAATNVQAAIAELASEKAALSSFDYSTEITATDWNTLIKNGKYYVIGASALAINGPLPAGDANHIFYLNVINGTSTRTNYVSQHATSAVTGNIYTRKNQGGTWSAWKEIPTTDTSFTKSSTTPTNRDLNNFTIADSYWHFDTGSGAVLNTPYGTLANASGQVGMVRNHGGSSARIVQYFDLYYSSGNANPLTAWRRTYNGDSGTWSAWQQVATANMITDYGIGTYNSGVHTADLLDKSGLYYCNNTGGALPGGISDCTILHNAYDGNHATQLAIEYNSSTTPRMWFRTKKSGVWNPWKQIATTDETTVAATAYDSAHLFSGNGYQKLSNGLILQWGRYVNTVGNATIAVTLPITFPNAFLVPSATLRGSNYYTGNSSCYADIISSSQIRLTIDEDSAGPSSDIFYFAIGY